MTRESEASLIEQIGTIPHCDPRILHAPGECRFCDQRAELQAIRRVWGIAFTGHAPVKREDGSMELPCPADAARGGAHQEWGGNRAAPPAPPVDYAARAVVGVAIAPGVPDETDRGDGQQRGYAVLSDAERARGFVRPVRRTYVHVGPPAPSHPLRDLTDEEKTRYFDYGYVKFEMYPPGFKGSAVGRFWTDDELAKVGKGCGVETTMSVAIAETYAREPKFYGATFCCGCGAHLRVGPDGEFVWKGSNERVGT